MPALTVWQHIYANVEREQSPENTAGFQTLYYSHDGLVPEDIDSIEARVFYLFDKERPVKKVFFQTPTGKIVVSHISANEDRDLAGRSGLYLAHSFIVESDAFIETRLSPMDLLQQLPFAKTIDEAFTCGASSSGNIKALKLNLSRTVQHAGLKWPTDKRRLFARFVTQTSRLKADRNAVALVGAPVTIEHALNDAFQLMPSRQMPEASFDTWFEKGGNLNFTYCWAIGFKKRPRQPFYHIVDVDHCKIESPLQAEEITTAYGRWVEAQLLNNPEANLSDVKDAADLVCSYLDGEDISTTELQAIPHQLLSSVLNANTTFAQHQVRSHLDQSMGPLLGEIIFPATWKRLSDFQKITAVRRGVTQHTLNQDLSSLGNSLNGKSFTEAVQWLVESAHFETLASLASGLEQLGKADLKKITALTEPHSSIPPVFRETLKRSVAAQSGKGGKFFKRFFK